MKRWAYLLVACVILLTILVPSAFAQTKSAPPKPEEDKSTGYPVVLGDQIIF
jgi:hypothetical protein